MLQDHVCKFSIVNPNVVVNVHVTPFLIRERKLFSGINRVEHCRLFFLGNLLENRIKIGPFFQFIIWGIGSSWLPLIISIKENARVRSNLFEKRMQEISYKIKRIKKKIGFKIKNFKFWVFVSFWPPVIFKCN